MSAPRRRRIPAARRPGRITTADDFRRPSDRLHPCPEMRRRFSARSFLEDCGFSAIRLDDFPEDIRSGFYKRGAAARVSARRPSAWGAQLQVLRLPQPVRPAGVGLELLSREQNKPPTCRSTTRSLHAHVQFVLGGLALACCRRSTHNARRRAGHRHGMPIRNAGARLRSRGSGSAGRGPLSHRNRSAHKPYQAYYTRELQDRVFERFQVDFEYFGYPYDLDGTATTRADARVRA